MIVGWRERIGESVKPFYMGLRSHRAALCHNENWLTLQPGSCALIYYPSTWPGDVTSSLLVGLPPLIFYRTVGRRKWRHASKGLSRVPGLVSIQFLVGIAFILVSTFLVSPTHGAALRLESRFTLCCTGSLRAGTEHLPNSYSWSSVWVPTRKSSSGHTVGKRTEGIVAFVESTSTVEKTDEWQVWNYKWTLWRKSKSCMIQNNVGGLRAIRFLSLLQKISTILVP